MEEALEVAHRNGEEYYEAELYRIKGEVLLMQPTVFLGVPGIHLVDGIPSFSSLN